MQAAELSQALATGIVNSHMSSGATGYDSKTYEHQVLVRHPAWLPKNAIIVNQAAFDALDPAAQAAVIKAAADAEAPRLEASQEKNDWYKKALAEKGMKIASPPPGQAAGRHEAGRRDLLGDWEKKAGADGARWSPPTASPDPTSSCRAPVLDLL